MMHLNKPITNVFLFFYFYYYYHYDYRVNFNASFQALKLVQYILHGIHLVKYFSFPKLYEVQLVPFQYRPYQDFQQYLLIILTI